MFAFICGLTFIIIEMVNTANILLIPLGFHSHITELLSVGKQLRVQGHSLHMIMMKSYPDWDKLDHEHINIISYHQIEKDIYSLPPKDGFQGMLEKAMKMTPAEDFKENVKGGRENCINLLSDDKLRNKVRTLNIDLAIVDAFPWNRCAYILLYSLNISYISITTQYEPWLFRLPALPSFVPFGLGAAYSEQMTFWERLHNTWNLVDWTAGASWLPFLDNTFVTKYAPNKPYLTINQLAHLSLLWLLDTNVFIDYPRPLMPNIIEIGGLTTKSANPLPQDLDDFMQKATKGVILVSFGSVIADLPHSVLKKLLDAFLAVDYYIIWKAHKFENYKTPDRIKFMDWLPQNDILGHNNTKLFITHAGANSQFEALYHGIPMISLPIWGDQPYNAKRVEYKGFGVKLDMIKSTPSDLVKSIKTVIEEPLYTKNILKASLAFKSQPVTPRQLAANWVEHVLEYGGHHLQSHALKMPWYQYLLLDVMGFLFVIVIVVIIFTYATLYYLIHCSNKNIKNKEKTT